MAVARAFSPKVRLKRGAVGNSDVDRSRIPIVDRRLGGTRRHADHRIAFDPKTNHIARL